MRPHRTPRLLLAVCSGLTVIALVSACDNATSSAGDNTSGKQTEANETPKDHSGNNHTPQASESASEAPGKSAEATPSQDGKATSPTFPELVRDAAQKAAKDKALIDIELSNNSSCTGVTVLTLTKMKGGWEPAPYGERSGFSNKSDDVSLDSLEIHDNPAGDPVEHWYFDCAGKQPGYYSVQFVSLDPMQVTEPVTITVAPAA